MIIRVLQYLLTLFASLLAQQSLLCTLSVFLIALATIRGIQILCESRKLPPGPWGVPLVGYLPFISGDFHLQLTELCKRHGSVFSLRLGKELFIVLADHNSIREAFRREEFAGRPSSAFNELIEGYGIFNTEGRLWRDQRRFLHERLRQFGMKTMGAGREKLEARIMNEVEIFLQMVACEKETPFNINVILSSSITNVICSMLMSTRFCHTDLQFQRFMTLIDEGFKLFKVTAPLNFIPALRYVPFVKDAIGKIKQNKEEMAEFFKGIINSHKESFDSDNIRDLVDTYLLEIQMAKEAGREKHLFEGKDPDRQMQQILGDLYSAGMETVKTTLHWAIIFMLHHPDVQKKVQAELDSIVGRKRLPSMNDLPLLPYTEATIYEVMRRSSVVPMGTTHAVTGNTFLNGHKIPKHANIIPLLHNVHMEPDLWEEPESFMPTRFFVNGKVKKPQFFMPFGVGRRMCLGDALAKMELFLFFSSLLHVFNILLPEGRPLPSLKGKLGATVTPEEYEVCAIPREIEIIMPFPGSDDRHSHA